MLQEFKAFIARGNVIDLAVGIIMGVAFTTIVNSLVNDIIMPPIGVLLGGVDFSNYYINLSGTHYDSLAAAKAAGAATINYGVFTNAIINFLIIAFAVFLLVKQVNRFMKKPEPAPAAPAAPPRADPNAQVEARSSIEEVPRRTPRPSLLRRSDPD